MSDILPHLLFHSLYGTCVEWTGGAGGGGAALASASCLLAAVSMTVGAQLLGLPFTVFVAVVTGGHLHRNTEV